MPAAVFHSFFVASHSCTCSLLLIIDKNPEVSDTTMLNSSTNAGAKKFYKFSIINSRRQYIYTVSGNA